MNIVYMQEVEVKMKKVAVLPVCILLIVALIAIAHSREKRNAAIWPYRTWFEGELPGIVDPGLRDLHTSTAESCFTPWTR